MNDLKYKVQEGVYILNESGSSYQSDSMKHKAKSIVKAAKKNLQNKEILLVSEN